MSRPKTALTGRLRRARVLLAMCCACAAAPALAGAQAEEALMPAVATLMSRAVSDNPVPADYADRPGVRGWLDVMSARLANRIGDARERLDFLATVHYEATRAGLDPQLLMGVIQHESGFRKYAISIAGARGYMQVMPFWLRLIGSDAQNLFHLRTNLRYGCVILRHYLDMEGGDLYRALGRYNGSLGRPEYPTAVIANMAKWQYTPQRTAAAPSPVAALAVGTSFAR